MPQTSLLVGIPMERTVDQSAFWSLLNIAQYGHPISRLAYTRDDIAHNKMGQQLLSGGQTHLMVVDVNRRHPLRLVETIAKTWDSIGRPDVLVTSDCAVVLVGRQVFDGLAQPWFRYMYNGDLPADWPEIWEPFLRKAELAGFRVHESLEIVSPYSWECAPEWDTMILSSDLRQDKDVLIGIPVERTVHQLAFHGFYELAKQGYSFLAGSTKRCDQAREDYCEALMRSEYRLLLMLDSDHIHPPNIVQSLQARLGGYPERKVIGGLNYRRSEPFDPCAGWWRKEERGWDTLVDWPHEVREVDVLGSGSMMIDRRALEGLPRPWFGYDYDIEAPEDYPGVDVHFSRVCNQHGVKLFVDPHTTSPHLTDLQVNEGLFKQHLRSKADHQGSIPGVTVKMV